MRHHTKILATLAILATAFGLTPAITNANAAPIHGAHSFTPLPDTSYSLSEINLTAEHLGAADKIQAQLWIPTEAND
jgi:hypothetical protein